MSWFSHFDKVKSEEPLVDTMYEIPSLNQVPRITWGYRENAFSVSRENVISLVSLSVKI